MKKTIILFLTAVMAFQLASCAGNTAENTPEKTPDAPAATADAAPTEEPAEIPREPELVFASDLYNGYGFVHQQCDTTGVYDFAPINSDNITWEVFILDREFNDAERFIPQAYERALSGGGSLSLKEGQWIYVYCPCNEWTTQTAPEGCAFSWGINPDRTYGDASIPNAEPMSSAVVPPSNIKITKNPTSEALTVGGKTWFIAHADNAVSVEWTFNDSKGASFDLEMTMALNPPLELEVLEGDTIALRNVPQSLNGWSVQANYSDGSSTVSTEPAVIYVGNFLDTYSGVISQYRNAYEGSDKSPGYAFDNGISEFISYSNHVGYALKDLDKNGVPELIIAGMGTEDFSNNVVYAIYTIENGQSVKICESQARQRYYLMTDNRIYMQGSSGAAYSNFEFYEVRGSKLAFTEGYATYSTYENAGNGFYHTTQLTPEGYADYSRYSDSMTLEQGTALTTAFESYIWMPPLTQIDK